MVSKAKNLTVDSINRIKTPTSGRFIHWDGKVRGFGLQVTAKGARTWVFCDRLKGKPIKMSFGRPGDETLPPFTLTLKDARTRASQMKTMMVAGIDPREQFPGLRRKAEPDAPATDTFAALLKDYKIKHLIPNTRRGHETERDIKNYLKPWMGKPYRDITKADLFEIIDLYNAVGKTGGACDAYRFATRIFNWAVSREKIEVSPFAGMKAPKSNPPRDRVLESDEIKALWNADLGLIAGGFIKMLLLTGQRRDAVAGIQWDEIDSEAKTWTIPAVRMKRKHGNDQSHVIPLSDLALDVLETMPRFKGGPFVFSTTGGKRPISGYSKIKAQIDKIIEIPHWTFHDLRRTLATGMQSLKIALPVTEKLLDHQTGSISGVAAIYHRYEYKDEVKDAVSAWAGRLNEIATGEMPENVVRISS